MAISLELPPDVEARLEAQARARGVGLDVYLKSILKEQAGKERSGQALGLEQFESELDALAAHSAKIPLLPLEALTREAIYQDRE
jgi:hypothetical protein